MEQYTPIETPIAGRLSDHGRVRRYEVTPGRRPVRANGRATAFAGSRVEPIEVKIRRLFDGVVLPARMTAEAAGFDLSAAVPSAVTIGPGEVVVVPCGFAMAIPPGYEAQVRPRSGLASRHLVTLVNSPGTIDSDYRGEIKVPLINHGKIDFVVEPGMRVAQMLVLPVPAVRLIEVGELDETARGQGGFGHTGISTKPDAPVPSLGTPGEG